MPIAARFNLDEATGIACTRQTDTPHGPYMTNAKKEKDHHVRNKESEITDSLDAF
jgi:hypothetical protein